MAYYGLTVPKVINIIRQANSSISAGDIKVSLYEIQNNEVI